MEQILIPGTELEDPALAGSSLTTLDCINDYIFNNLRKPNRKQPALFQNVSLFVQQNKSTFYYSLRRLAITILFENHRNLWIFNRCLHSTILMCETCEPQDNSGRCLISQKIFEEVILTFEKNTTRRNSLMIEINRLLCVPV